MADKSEVARLHSLAQLDADAVGAYDVAIARIGPALVRERLNSFRADHLRHVQDLNTLIRDEVGPGEWRCLAVEEAVPQAGDPVQVRGDGSTQEVPRPPALATGALPPHHPAEVLRHREPAR